MAKLTRYSMNEVFACTGNSNFSTNHFLPPRLSMPPAETMADSSPTDKLSRKSVVPGADIRLYGITCRITGYLLPERLFPVFYFTYTLSEPFCEPPVTLANKGV